MSFHTVDSFLKPHSHPNRFYFGHYHAVFRRNQVDSKSSLPITVFETPISGVVSDCSIHCATTIAAGRLVFLKMGQSRPLFVYFCYFLITISIQIEKSIDGVLGIRTQGRRMVGADETTELRRPPLVCLLYV